MKQFSVCVHACDHVKRKCLLQHKSWSLLWKQSKNLTAEKQMGGCLVTDIDLALSVSQTVYDKKRTR